MRTKLRRQKKIKENRIIVKERKKKLLLKHGERRHRRKLLFFFFLFFFFGFHAGEQRQQQKINDLSTQKALCGFDENRQIKSRTEQKHTVVTVSLKSIQVVLQGLLSTLLLQKAAKVAAFFSEFTSNSKDTRKAKETD